MVSNLIPWRRHKDVKVTRLANEEPHPYLALHRQWDSLFDDLFRDFEEVFGVPSLSRFGSSSGTLSPRVDVSETDEAFIVSADLPGLDENDIEVALDDNALVIKGEKKDEREEKKKEYHLMERSYGEFRRSVPLPRGVDLEKVKAGFKRGVLTVTLPKTPEAQTSRRVIDVEAD